MHRYYEFDFAVGKVVKADWSSQNKLVSDNRRFAIFLFICTFIPGVGTIGSRRECFFCSGFISTKVKILTILKPAGPKRALLFVAALVWTFAGSMLLYKGFKMLDPNPSLLWLKLLLVLLGGILFYQKLFSKLSLKHTLRILKMKEAYPCFFSFFNFRSYLVMCFMISMGITLRTTGWVPLVYLSYLYLMMSVPLLLSSVRFYYTGIFYRKYLVISLQE